jgi:hypothetical protein
LNSVCTDLRKVTESGDHHDELSVENEIIAGSTVGLSSVDLVDSCGFLWILVDSCGLNRLVVLKDQMQVNAPI